MKSRTTRSHRLAAALKNCLALSLALLLSQCAGPRPNQHCDVVVSVKEQKMAVYNATTGKPTKKYPVSTSKFGLNDKKGKFGTPLGTCEVVAKIGKGVPAGGVFKTRKFTGEVIKPDSPGRDPIVSRILWLRGLEKQNEHAYARCIYIHGTAEERNIGKPVSYGCIRMKSKDVIDLFDRLPIGSRVTVVTSELPSEVPPALPVTVPDKPVEERPPIMLAMPKDAESEKPEKKPLLATNTKATATPAPEMAGSPTTSRAPVPVRTKTLDAASVPPGTVSTDSPAPPKRHVQHFQSGEKVLYEAPAVATGPNLVLKSKRSASQRD